MAELHTVSGDVLTIDDEDVPLLAGRVLYTARGKYTNYARWPENTPEGRKWLLVHRFLMAAPDGVLIDHIDMNGMNCRRSNMRFATQSLNQANRDGVPGTSSRYKGVTLNGTGKWFARIGGDDGYHIGVFVSEEDAARAYDCEAVKTWGSHARLNFPGEPLWTPADVRAAWSKRYHGQSRYRGVVWDKVNKKWQAKLRVKGKAYCPGRFATQEEAARAYDEVALRVLGDKADLNFPPPAAESA